MNQEYIRSEYAAGKSSRQIARHLGVCNTTILRVLRRLGQDRRPVGTERKYTLNEGAFNSLTDEAKYWIGFLMADACVSSHKTRKVLCLSVQQDDAPHLNHFLTFLKSNQPVRADRNSAKVQICSKQLCDKLSEFNVTPRKSFTANPPSQLIMDRHFWRGMIDGDGWIIPKHPVLGLCGTYECCSGFRTYCLSLVETTAQVSKQGKIWRFTLSHRKAKEVIRTLYQPGDMTLERKRQKALSC